MSSEHAGRWRKESRHGKGRRHRQQKIGCEVKDSEILNVIDVLGPGVSNFKSERNPEIGGKGWVITLKNVFLGRSFSLQKN